METRIEKDSLGELKVPIDALYGANTQRAVKNFPISDLKMPRSFIKALGLIKAGAAYSNNYLELLESDLSKLIQTAATNISDGYYDQEFPVDVFQTGSGTSSNMNINEVITQLVKKKSNINIHPNDHVNMSQSSNDVIPTAIHVSAAIEVNQKLIPAINNLINSLAERAVELENIVLTGRTHLMDAMPVTFSQVLNGYKAQLTDNLSRIKNCLPRIQKLSIGGTAVGTGINAHPNFAKHVCEYLTTKTGINFTITDNYFAGISSQDNITELSSHLKTVSITLMKISNDLRWMNSGPLAGLSEITLPTIQAGSSIMPGKVNPVIPESICMLCAQVIGNDTTITIAGQSGNFQLNVMLPVIAYNILQSTMLLSNGCELLADRVIPKFTVNNENINKNLIKNPILVTALNSIIGYEKGALIAKKAYKEKRSIKEVALEMTNLSEPELDKLLDPLALTKGGIKN